MAMYQTQYSKGAWKYGDYIRVGAPTNGARAFQTLNRQDIVNPNNPWSDPANWSDSSEEFHYQYDSAGRLTNAAFAQTPNGSYSNPASYRARAYYSYEPAGRLSAIEYYWDTYSSGYASVPIKGQAYTYNAYTGLRTQANYYVNSGGSWSLEHTEKYAYDANLDYLTGATYDGSTPGTDWTYDAAGNRSNSGFSYDNLNRMTASPKSGGGTHSYENDILGNMTWRDRYVEGTGRRMTWDEVDRMKSCSTPSSGASYQYHADGMRVKRVEGLTLSWNPDDEEHESGWYDEIQSTNLPTTRYFYDGQMVIEEDFTIENGFLPTITKTRYGLGARGVDFLSTQIDSGSETVKFPIYDGHGNMIATLARNGSSYTLANERLYDVWGSVRSGSTSGAPSQRYCANLGHKQDDESGLIYMRARYYEPSTGRFVSEDPARDAWNWFSYCSSDPTNYLDFSGLYRGSNGFMLSWAINMARAFQTGDFETVALILSTWLQLSGLELPPDVEVALSTLSARPGRLVKTSLGAMSRNEGMLEQALAHVKKIAEVSGEDLARYGPHWVHEVKTLWQNWIDDLQRK